MLRSKQFASYEIIRKLGRGMTDVYLAFDSRSNRQAVLKIVEESPDSMTQLTMEAERRGAALQKQLHDFDSRVWRSTNMAIWTRCWRVPARSNRTNAARP